MLCTTGISCLLASLTSRSLYVAPSGAAKPWLGVPKKCEDGCPEGVQPASLTELLTSYSAKLALKCPDALQVSKSP